MDIAKKGIGVIAAFGIWLATPGSSLPLIAVILGSQRKEIENFFADMNIEVTIDPEEDFPNNMKP